MSEIVRAVTESNVFLKVTSTGGSLSTVSNRASFILREFSVVMPEELLLKNKQTFVYVHILKMLQTLLNNGDVLDKAMAAETRVTGIQVSQGRFPFQREFSFV